jgi:hypothetical protein
MGEIAAAAKQGPGQGPATLALGNRLGGGSLLRPHPQLSRCNSLTGAMPAGCQRQRALMNLRRLTSIVHCTSCTTRVAFKKTALRQLALPYPPHGAILGILLNDIHT